MSKHRLFWVKKLYHSGLKIHLETQRNCQVNSSILKDLLGYKMSRKLCWHLILVMYLKENVIAKFILNSIFLDVSQSFCDLNLIDIQNSIFDTKNYLVSNFPHRQRQWFWIERQWNIWKHWENQRNFFPCMKARFLFWTHQLRLRHPKNMVWKERAKIIQWKKVNLPPLIC